MLFFEKIHEGVRDDVLKEGFRRRRINVLFRIYLEGPVDGGT
jgi:hypothetical protein